MVLFREENRSVETLASPSSTLVGGWGEKPEAGLSIPLGPCATWPAAKPPVGAKLPVGIELTLGDKLTLGAKLALGTK